MSRRQDWKAYWIKNSITHVITENSFLKEKMEKKQSTTSNNVFLRENFSNGIESGVRNLDMKCITSPKWWDSREWNMFYVLMPLKSQVMTDFLESEGIVHQKNNAYTYKNNDLAGRPSSNDCAQNSMPVIWDGIGWLFQNQKYSIELEKNSGEI